MLGILLMENSISVVCFIMGFRLGVYFAYLSILGQSKNDREMSVSEDNLKRRFRNSWPYH